MEVETPEKKKSNQPNNQANKQKAPPEIITETKQNKNKEEKIVSLLHTPDNDDTTIIVNEQWTIIFLANYTSHAKSLFIDITCTVAIKSSSATALHYFFPFRNYLYVFKADSWKRRVNLLRSMQSLIQRLSTQC